MHQRRASLRPFRLAALVSALLLGGVIAACSADEDPRTDAATSPGEVLVTLATPSPTATNEPTAVAAATTTCEVKAQATATAQTSAQPSATMEVVYIDYEWAAEYNKKDILVSEVDDVFIGTVLSMGDTFSRLGRLHDTWTPYTVEVEEVLLGDVSGEITVVQHGGFDCGHDWLVLIRGDSLLDVGKTYLLATSADRSEDPVQHVVVPIWGHVPVDDEVQRQWLIEEYTDAIEQAGLAS